MSDCVTGHCLCGDVSYEISGEPAFIGHCHCQSCRRFSGAAVATYVGVLKSQVRFSTGEAVYYESAPGIRWGSCSRCGTSLTYAADWCSQELHFLIGTFDHPENLIPRSHSFYSERIEWLHIDEDLPKDPEVLQR